MFFFRNSDWSRQFLDRWWNQTGFIQPFGQSKSGDNAALKHLISIMDKDELNRHVRFPQMQCLFNSNLWRPSWRSCHRLMTVTKAVWQGRLFFEYSQTFIESSVRVECATLTVFVRCQWISVGNLLRSSIMAASINLMNLSLWEWLQVFMQGETLWFTSLA